MIKDLNSEQKKALKALLQTNQNIYLTGAGGTGKSHIIKLFREIKKLQQSQIPIVASTGAAALLVNGVTFNSYFGLGIMAGGIEQTINTAMTSRVVCERIIYTDCVIIDEISMISATTFKAANLLCQKIRKNKKPFGGIRLICVGDFLQLGPYSETNKVDWIFNGTCWKEAKVKKIELSKIMRTTESSFLKVLGKVRFGKIDKEVSTFLNKKVIKKGMEDFDGARIFSRNHEVDSYNEKKLKSLTTPLITVKTQYVGDSHAIERMRENLVIPENLYLKKGALIMMRVNNFQEGYVNGTMGHIVGIGNDVLTIKKLSGETIQIKKHIFEFLNGSGEVIAKAKNYPLTLAWAITIHKAQGASLDKALISIDRLWLHGQAYTALSRLRSEKGLFLEKWDKKSFIVDKSVLKFINKK